MAEDTGATLKCALNEAGSNVPVLKTADSFNGDVQIGEETCTSSLDEWRGGVCTLDMMSGASPQPKVLDRTSNEGTDYNRFCFYECQPHDFTLGQMCVPMSSAELAQSETQDGNGQDVGMLPEEGSDAGVPTEIRQPVVQRVEYGNMAPMAVPVYIAAPSPAVAAINENLDAELLPMAQPKPAEESPMYEVANLADDLGAVLVEPPRPDATVVGARRRAKRIIEPVVSLPPSTRPYLKAMRNRAASRKAEIARVNAAVA